MPELSPKQQLAIPKLLNSATVAEGAEQVGVARKTIYEWLKDPEFVAELEAQRALVKDAALHTLAKSMLRAINELAGLLTTKDERLRRQVANDIIDKVLQLREYRAIEERLKALEDRLKA